MSRTSPMWVGRCRTTDSSATGQMRIGSRTGAIRFDGVAPDPTSAPEAFAAIARVVGMEIGRPTVALPKLGPTFLEQIDVLQRVHLSLFPHHHESPIRARHRRERDPLADDDRRTAAFFSGGVDSFALIEEHGDRIDDLLFVRGFDVPVHDRERNEEVLTLVRAAADAIGKPLIVVDTDLREFTDRWADWTWFVYGGLIATALLLERTHRTVLCAASVADHHLPDEAVRWRGTGFGNERTTLYIEGRTTTRVEKIAAIARSGVARDALRVCWQNVDGTINCGTCQKCIRTLVGLAATGGMGTIATLPDQLDLDAVARHPATSRSDRAYLIEARDAARAHGFGDIVGALDRALASGDAARS